LNNIKGVDFIMLDERDIVRHKLVSKIVEAYDKEKDRRT
ncbi:MAG: PhoH family protein, partial [Bacteroidetes bacterium]|nr:PhoH family protein [Bacteroidota bacterium]